MKNGCETLILGQILTFKWHFITLSLASSPFVRTTQTESRLYVGSLFVLYRITKGALFVFPEENFRAEITVNIVDRTE